MLPFWRNKSALLRWVLSALAETAVATPWMLLAYASNGGDDWPAALPGAWLPLLVFLAAGLWEAGDRKEDPKRRLYALGGGVLTAYLLAYQAVPVAMHHGVLAYSHAIFFIPVAAYLWFQGAKNALEGIEYGRILSRFSLQFGLILGGVLLLMLMGQASDAGVQLLLYWSVLLLFAAGLSLVLVTRDRALKADQAKMGEKGTESSPNPAMLAVVAVLVGLTLTASYLLSVDRLLGILGAIAAFLAPPLNWVSQVAFLIIVRWLMLLSPLFRLLQRLAARQEVEAPQSQTGLEEPPPPPLPETGPPFDIEPYVKGLVILVALLLVARSLLRLVRARRLAAEGDEERLSLGFWRSLWADLKALFGRGAGRVATVVGAVTTAVLPEDPRDARGLFRRLQRWGASQGRPRGAAETPTHYQQALGGLAAEAAEPAAAVTAVYNQARYGRSEPDGADVERARGALEQLEKGPG